MRDFLGQEVNVGDHVFYSTTGRYSESRYCRVIRLTPKSIVVDVLKKNRSGSLEQNVIVRNSFIKVGKPIPAKASAEFTYIVDYLSEGDLEHLQEEVASISQILN